MSAPVVVWFSRYEPLPAHIEALKKIYGENVEIKIVNRKFESTTHFLQYLKEVNARGVYAVVPLEKVKEMMNTEIGKNIDWLWAEYEEITDGVRREEEKGFEPDKDIAGYYYNLGQHRRFKGFSKIIDYQLKTQPLISFEIPTTKQQAWTKEKWREAWKNTYMDMLKELNKNKVKINIKEYPNGKTLVSVAFEKDTDMFEHLRPVLKNMGFEFSKEHTDWSIVLENKEDVRKILEEIKKMGNIVIENLAVRTLQKHQLPEHKADFLCNQIKNRVELISVKQRKMKVRTRNIT